MFTHRNFLIGAFATVSAVSFAANPVLVDSAGSGQFTSLQTAISSWTTTGTNAAETAPFVINIKAGSGPYDEALTLDSTAAGFGDIVGNLVIKSDTPGTKVQLRLRKGIQGTSAAADNDGLFIFQNVHSVSFTDVIFNRSIVAAPDYATDELVRVDENGANATLNTMSFTNCVFTEPGTTGAPLVTDKAGALVAPPAIATGYGGAARIAGARLLQIFGDPGESMSAALDNCVFYGGATGPNVQIRLEGTTGAGPGAGYAETLTINNCLSTYAFGDCFNIGGQNQNAVQTVTGTDQKAGPLNCTAAIMGAYLGGTVNNGHGFTVSTSGNAAIAQANVINISKTLVYNVAGASASSTAARGISGGQGRLTITDAIIAAPNLGTVVTPRTALTWNKVTIHDNDATGSNAVFVSGTGAPAGGWEGSLTINNSILSGPGTKIGVASLPAGITLNNCGLPTAGPDAIGAVGTTAANNNSQTGDPQYLSKDGLLASAFDVSAPSYATAAQAGAPLSGGANYQGASVDEWSMY